MKSYSKPEILFDCFELSENIASCAAIDSGMAQYQCPVFVPDLGIQIFTASNCEFEPAEGMQPCYGVPFEGFNVFKS